MTARIFVLGLLCCFARGFAQEMQVPLDSAGKVMVIDRELENKLGLFQDYPSFVEARLYQQSDTLFVLEILYGDTNTYRSRVEMRPPEVKHLRRRVTEAIHIYSPASEFDQSGRGGMLVNSAILSLGYHGWAIPVAAQATGSGAGALYFLIGAAGVLVPYLATDRANVTRADAQMYFYGGSRGIAHGVFVYYAFHGTEQFDEAPYGWGSVFSITESVLGYYWAEKSRMSEGESSVIGVGGDFGIAMSASLTGGYDLWDEEETVAEAGAWCAAGSAIGIIAGKQLADHGDYSRGDAFVLRSIGILGAAIPAALADAAEADGGDAAVGATAGSVVALGIGHHMLKHREFSRSQGLMILMGEIGGAALFTSFVVAANPETTAPYSLAAAAGATAGFALFYSMESRSARTRNQKAGLDFDFGMNPLPLFAQGDLKFPAEQEHRRNMVVNVSCRF
ncbi:hypothetical protein IT157_08790 [bacterium]|nr:hypothetical protein [bacterium]